jgi:hypothetical protein
MIQVLLKVFVNWEDSTNCVVIVFLLQAAPTWKSGFHEKSHKE